MITWVADDVWTQLRSQLASPGRKFAAIAFVSSAAPELLRLRRDDTILICASDECLERGITNPAAVATWLRDGVEVWSVPSLHAKFVVFGTEGGSARSVFVGSANASARASVDDDLLRSLEAGLYVDDPGVAEEARLKVEVWKARADPPRPLDASWVRHAKQIYRAPQRRRTGAKSRGARPVEGARIWLGQSVADDRALSPEAERAFKAALDASASTDWVETWILNPGDEKIVLAGHAVSLVPIAKRAREPHGQSTVKPPGHVAAVVTSTAGPPVAIIVYDATIRPRRTWASVRRAIQSAGGSIQFDEPLDLAAAAALNQRFFNA